MHPNTKLSEVLAIMIIASMLASFFGFASPAAATSELFFSEYVEGSSNNKALEIYNGTGTAVDLSAYTVELYSNGASSATASATLSGMLADSDVYVIAHPSADSAILAVADATSGSVVNFNGDDAVVLKNGGTVIDAIGQAGFDPGSQWGSGNASTKDNTIRRKATVCVGDTNPSDAFDPATEWDGFAKDTFDGLGTHSITCASDTPPSVSSTTPANTTTGVAINANIEIDFSEAVNVAGGWFQVVCGASGTRDVDDTSVTGGPTNWTIDPNVDFSNGETCTVTVFATQVNDTDTDDPPDNMTADYIFDFTVVAAASGWVINEIHADPAGDLSGDANGDGTRDSGDDEFVEIVNSLDNDVDISGWTLADETKVRHTFPGGTVVPAHCTVVIFGGGTPTGSFGGAVVQTASSGKLVLNNDGDTITLNDGTVDQATYTYGGEGGDNQSLTRNPDITGATPLVKHSTATGSGGALFSPGTRIDGTNFSCGEPTAITLASFSAQAGDDGVTLAWETAAEIDNAGFNVYRAASPDGPWTQINGGLNGGLIAAQGSPVSGASYSFPDRPGYGTFYYKLEDVDFFGVSTFHGPVSVELGSPIRAPWFRPALPEFSGVK